MNSLTAPNKIANTCGGCSACCYLYTIPEFNKPRMTPCIHQCEAGCEIHDQDRPPVCTEFWCSWIDEGWETEMRPDKSNIIFLPRGTIDDVFGTPRKLYVGNMISSYAHLRRKTEAFLERLKLKAACLLVWMGDDGEGFATHRMSVVSERLFPGWTNNKLYKAIGAAVNCSPN